MSDKCPDCRGWGWLHYSNGAPVDVCENCHGTGTTSAYAAYNLLEEKTKEIRRLEKLSENQHWALGESSKAMREQSDRIEKLQDAIVEYVRTGSDANHYHDSYQAAWDELKAISKEVLQDD